jgi:hypothetical protein
MWLRHADGKMRRDGLPAALLHRTYVVDERGRVHGAPGLVAVVDGAAGGRFRFEARQSRNGGGEVTEQEFQTWARGQCADVAKRIVESMPCMQITIQPAGVLASWPQTGEGIMICVPNYRLDKTLEKPAIPPVLQMNVLASLGCPGFVGRT